MVMIFRDYQIISNIGLAVFTVSFVIRPIRIPSNQINHCKKKIAGILESWTELK